MKIASTLLLFVCLLYTIDTQPKIRFHEHDIDNHYTQLLLEKINDYWNTRITYTRERDGVDIWQTPKETRLSGKGDCEDYAIIKMFNLLQMDANIKASNLFLAYVRTYATGPHLILLFGEIGGEDFLVLDNSYKDVISLSASIYDGHVDFLINPYGYVFIPGIVEFKLVGNDIIHRKTSLYDNRMTRLPYDIRIERYDAMLRKMRAH